MLPTENCSISFVVDGGGLVTRYRVSQGDCASSIAAKLRFRDFRTIWEDAGNSELRSVRPDPNVLFPGDELVIPDHQERIEEAETGKRHVFVARSQRTTLRLRIEVSRPNAYELVVDEATTFRGTTDGSEPIVHPIDAGARRARLSLWLASEPEPPLEARMTIPITLGALDPISEVSGVQGRLKNLGFYDGAIDDALDEATRESIRAFQRYLSKPATGQVTAELRADLVQHHDV